MIYEVYQPDYCPGEPLSVYRRTKSQAKRYADLVREHHRVGVYECDLDLPAGRVEGVFALLNGLTPVRGDLVYGKDWANRRPEHPPSPATEDDAGELAAEATDILVGHEKLVAEAVQAERERCVDVVNECRAIGESDLRGVRDRIAHGHVPGEGAPCP